MQFKASRPEDFVVCTLCVSERQRKNRSQQKRLAAVLSRPGHFLPLLNAAAVSGRTAQHSTHAPHRHSRSIPHQKAPISGHKITHHGIVVGVLLTRFTRPHAMICW